MDHYEAQLVERVLPPSIPVGMGRKVTPGQPPTLQGVVDALVALIDVEKRIQFELDEMLKVFRANFPGPDSVALLKPSGAPVQVLSAATTEILAFTIDAGFEAYVRKLGLKVDGSGQAATAQWKLYVNGVLHPKFDANIFYADSLATPLDFFLKLGPGQTVSLQCFNGDASAINCYAVMSGWMNPIRR